MVRKVHLTLGTALGEEGHDYSDHKNHVSKAAFRQIMSIAGALERDVFPFAEIFDITVLDADSATLSASLVNNKTSQLRLNWRCVPALSISYMLKRIQAGSRTNKINCLDISFRNDDEAVPKILSLLGDTLNRMHALETLHLPSFITCDQNIWENIRQLPYLRNLHESSIVERPRLESYLTPVASIGEGFPTLAKFRCALPHATASRLFSPSIPKYQLQEIHILVYDLSDAIETYTLLTEIARAAPNLRDFGMDFTESEHALKIEIFTPILQLTNISSLILRTDLANKLTDEKFQMIVDAVPRLQVLSITPSTVTAESTRPLATLKALNFIARRCASIRSLCIHLDASNARLPSYFTRLEQLPHTLSQLNFGLSVCEDPLRTALQLMRMLRYSYPRVHSHKASEFLHRVKANESKKYADAAQRWLEVASCVRQLRPFVDSVVESLVQSSDGSDVSGSEKDLMLELP